MRRILFVDDEPRILDGLQRMLRPRRQEWDMHFAPGPAAAIAALQSGSTDVIVTDMRMPEMDGAMLLELVMRQWPSTVRVVLSGQTEAAAAERTVRVAHQFLSKPCEPDELFSTIERLCVMRDLLGNEVFRRAVGTVETVPCVPAVYAELESAMRSTNTALPAITAIVERNTGLCAKILQLVNSSFFGRPRRITRIEMAVGLLGLNVLRSLVLSHEIANSFTGAGAAGVISLEDEQAHALLTAALARRFAPTPAEADTAFIAGVLHDVGKLVLASKLPGAFREVLAEARSAGRPLHEVEFDRNGASHAEVGACLLGLWGLPTEVVAAVAHHHRPDAAPATHTRRAAEIHVADVLAHELIAGNGGNAEAVASTVIPTLNEPWLASIGVLDSVPRWRALAVEIWAERPEA